MPIGEGHAAAAIVITGRNIARGTGSSTIQKIPVVDGIGMLVDKEPGLSRFGHAGPRHVLSVLRRGPVTRRNLVSRITALTGMAEKRVHRNAANPLLEPRGNLGRA